MLADIYGPRACCKRADDCLPAALVQGHPGYLRAMHGVKPLGDTWLTSSPPLTWPVAPMAAGVWCRQRTQAPSGLGYLLENRIAIARQFPKAFAWA